MKLNAHRQQGRPEHGSGHSHSPHDQKREDEQRDEVVPLPQRQLSERTALDLDRTGAEPSGLGFDHHEDRRVVQRCGDERHDHDLQERDVQELCNQERGGAHPRGRQDRADTGRSQHSAADLSAISGASEYRPRHGPQCDRARDAASGRQTEQVTRDHNSSSWSRSAASPPDRRKRPVHKEATCPAVLEDGAVDDKQHNVSRRDVEGDTKDTFEGHVEGRNEAIDGIPAVADERQPNPIEQRTVVAVREKGHHSHWKNQSACASRCFEDEQDGNTAKHDVDRERRRCPVHERIEVEDWPRQRDDAQRGQHPVDRRDLLARPATAIEKEGQNERDEEKADSIDLRLDNGDNPIQRVQRERDGESASERASPAAQGSRPAFALKLFDRGLQAVDGQR